MQVMRYFKINSGTDDGRVATSAQELSIFLILLDFVGETGNSDGFSE